MTDASIQPSADALLDGPKKSENPNESTIAQVAKDFGVHPLRQMKDILSLRISAQKLGSNEYYDLRIFDPVYDKTAKRQFLGQGGINALNLQMNPDRLMETKNFIANKLTYTHHLKDAGIASTETQAFVTTEHKTEQDFVLKDAAEIVTFMREKAVYPLFGKPFGGSLSVGSVRIHGIEDDKLCLGKGGSISVEAFAADVLRVYPDGYLLQTSLTPHKDLAKIAGDAIGSLRLVTTHDGTAAKTAYATWKLPAENAISDNSWQEGTMLAQINLTDGTVINCHRGKGPTAELLQQHPISKLPIVGVKIPFWEEALRSACAAHELFPDLGICGFDVAITDEGPVILECNDNPNHMVYQYPAREGIRNAALDPLWKEIIARQKKAA